MRYMMKQRIFAWGDDFTIRDEGGRDVYFVDGAVFTIGKKLSFQDPGGTELARIEQRLLNWGPTYEIIRDGRVAAVVRKKLFTFFRCEFTIDEPGPNDPVAEGNFLHYDYTIRRGGVPIAIVSKKWFAWSDTYGVEIADDEDHVLLLAATVVIDMACHNDDD